MRAPFQILAIPYRKKQTYRFCVFQRADTRQYQFIAGGGENDELPLSVTELQRSHVPVDMGFQTDGAI